MKLFVPAFTISLVFSSLSVASNIEEDGQDIKRAQQNFGDILSKGKEEESDSPEAVQGSSRPSGERPHYIFTDTMICMVPANQGLFSGLEF